MRDIVEEARTRLDDKDVGKYKTLLEALIVQVMIALALPCGAYAARPLAQL